MPRRGRLIGVIGVVGAGCVLIAACSSSASGGGPSSTQPSGAGPSSAGPSSAGQPSTSAPVPGELPAAAAIAGVAYHPELDRSHKAGPLQYDASPPVGGAHSAVWADCGGAVYPNPIASENAVHSLEHGAVWITYRPGLSDADLASLTQLVQGQDHLLVSPYPGLSSAISLQSWGYQLFVDSPSDPRVIAFINLLRSNRTTTPEYGEPCTNPAFKQNPSTPGHPIDG